MTTTASDDATGKSCPYCRFPIKDGARVERCSACGAIHHDDCWSDNGGCAVVGCANGPTRSTGGRAQEVPSASEPPTQVHQPVPAVVAGQPHAPKDYGTPPPPGPAPAAGSSVWRVVAATAAIFLALAGAAVAVVVATGRSSAPPMTNAQAAVTTVVQQTVTIDGTTTDEVTPGATDESLDPPSTDQGDAEVPTTETPPPVAHPAVSQSSRVKAMLRRHFQDLVDGQYDRAYDDLTRRATTADRSGWVDDQQADGLYAFDLEVSTQVSGSYGIARILTFHTEASSSGCHDWSGYWEVVRSGGRWYISKSKLVRGGGSCG